MLSRKFICFLFITSIASTTNAGILFEGWSKVLISGTHVGYIIQRYDFDEKKKEFRETHFMKIEAGSASLTDSLVARSDASLKPISYQYTALKDGKATLIDASFKNGKMTASVTEGKDKKTIRNTLPKGSFLSAFLGYAMLQGKEGLKKGVKYKYQAVLEESASLANGEAYIAEEETVSGIPAFRILNTIDGAKFINLSSHKGEVLGTVSPAQGVQTVLVSRMEEATGKFEVNKKALTQLFGTMPLGKDNELSQHSLLPVVPATSLTPVIENKPATQKTDGP